MKFDSELFRKLPNHSRFGIRPDINSPCIPFMQEEEKILYYYPERDLDISN